jgi:hypothetical protein
VRTDGVVDANESDRNIRMLGGLDRFREAGRLGACNLERMDASAV